MSKARIPRRRGVALLMTVFVVAVVSMILLGILDVTRTQTSALQNTIDYERAQQLAGAGVHHAIAVLAQDSSFTGPLPEIEFPRGSGMRYTATVERTDPSTVKITGAGASGDVTRRLEVTVAI